VKSTRKLLREEAGVEPIVMKLLAAVVLLAIGLSIGVALYKKAGSIAENTLENLENIG
jgi:NADH:ubiquinone oxidoreductase subunit K